MVETTNHSDVRSLRTNGTIFCHSSRCSEGRGLTLKLGATAQGPKSSPTVGSIKSEISHSSVEIHSLGSSRPPSMTSISDQQLTRYHSLIYGLLSWEEPRATATSFASVVFAIFAARYLPLLRWIFKFLYLSLGFTAAVEVAGRLVLSHGLIGSFRPRKYFTIPKEALEATLEDLQQLLDFFLIEFQRVLFVENIPHTATAFSAAFAAYWLIKILPLWGLSLIAATIAYLGPFVYIQNRKFIDAHISHAQSIIDSKAYQLRDLTQERTIHAAGVVKQYIDDYSVKAQEYMESMSPHSNRVLPSVKASLVEPEITAPDFSAALKSDLTESGNITQESAGQEQ